VERVRRPEPETYRKPEGELDLNTTAKMAYTRKPMEKATPIKPQETHVAPGKFEGTSTSQVSVEFISPIRPSVDLSLVHTSDYSRRCFVGDYSRQCGGGFTGLLSFCFGLLASSRGR